MIFLERLGRTYIRIMVWRKSWNLSLAGRSPKGYQVVPFRLYTSIAYSSDPHGVEGRLPVAWRTKGEQSGGSENTQVSITDPFILYQNYVSRGSLMKDENQLRIMKEFQRLYYRVVDYTPPEELSIKISLIMRKIELKQAEKVARQRGRSFIPMKYSHIKNLFKKDPDAEKKQLTKFITDEDELYNFASPQGLMVNGEVGCGKSMLMDIFAASLPHSSKMRWHFNNFILWVYNEMHRVQNERRFTDTVYNNESYKRMTMENEFILFEIAQKMINKNTILMLDEFMLPDIASANIIKILFTYYFKLGGVLVATSNKLPEELYSNSFHKTKFKSFVDILNARCHSVEMRSSKDYRSFFASKSSQDLYLVVKSKDEGHDHVWTQLIMRKALGISDETVLNKTKSISELDGKPSFFKVYNRRTDIQLTFNDDSICYLDFSYICQGLYSSSDYITLASRYHTIILDNVPILTIKMKNEARRFITLLDALYEAKCQFFMRSEVDVDSIFFPDALGSEDPYILKKLKETNKDNYNRLDVQDEEMFSKTTIAISNPYRPNISSYDQEHTETYDDFKGSTIDVSSRDEPTGENEKDNVNFKDMKAFTGEDEKFAYKRAVSRIKEMIGSEIWREQNRWIPIDESMRPWERKRSLHNFTTSGTPPEHSWETEGVVNEMLKDEKTIKKLAQDQLMDTLPKDFSTSRKIPFSLFNERAAPIFSNISHFWAMGPWTSASGKRLKDSIVKSWIRSSIRDENKT